LLKKRSGIVLGDNKHYLVESRLAPIAQMHGFVGVGDLLKGIATASATVLNAVVDAMTTNESLFFRDTTPFVQFEKIMLPALARARRGTGRIRVWCAAASTGQEPYSLAMVLLSTRPLWSGLIVEIVATDLSESALQRASEGRYTQFEVQRGLPVQRLVAHFRQDGTTWIVSEEVRRMVRFQKLNLLDPLTGLGPMDVVFCRNVLIYFDAGTKTEVISAIRGITRPDGFLVLGATETMMGISDDFGRVDGERGLYRPAAAESVGRVCAI
jgi:chemotaxis protein methyltransferase CheR